jgi:Mg-chelatase subunit ChlD
MILVVVLALLAGGIATAGAANLDCVVMVDTSESMFPYFDDLMNYLVQDLLTAKLHRGDTFHLLSFSSVPEVEISLEINSDAAAQQAFGRILLLHALGRYTDLVAALQFLDKYVKELPETNPKQIILITDGVNDPPPGSPNGGDPEAVRAAILAATQGLRKAGWTFDILKVPPQPEPGDTAKSYLGDISQALGVSIVPYKVSDKENVTGRTTGFPNLVFPGFLGKVGNRFNAPFKVKNWKNETIIIRLSSVQSDGVELLEKKVTTTVPPMGEAALAVPLRLPLSYPKGEHKAAIRLVFEDDLRISPTSGTLNFQYTGKGGLPIPRLTFLYILYIVLGLAVIYLLIRLFLFMRKKLGEAPLTGIARGQSLHEEQAAPGSLAAGAPVHPALAGRKVSRRGHAPAPASVRKKIPLLSASEPVTIPARRVRPTVTSIRRSLPRQSMQQASLPPLIEMRVSLQNHRVGFRNVHRITEGASRTIGGHFSSFLIFLVPVPASIAEIRNVDGGYVFTPLRTELFPSISGSVEDCLEKEIPFVTPRGRELTLHFRRWESPLDEVNRVLRQARSQE